MNFTSMSFRITNFIDSAIDFILMKDVKGDHNDIFVQIHIFSPGTTKYQSFQKILDEIN